MSDELLRRMEKTVRRFGGPMAIDDLLPELDAESGVELSSAGEGRAEDSGPNDSRRVSDGAPVPPAARDSIEPNI